jgi:DNA-binding response OmpR family regulator
MKILIVEDEDLIRKTLQRALIARAHQVEVAPNGFDGLSLVKSFQPDLILLDLLMPVKNGFEFMAESDRNTAIIIMTAYSGDSIENFNSVDYPFVIGIIKKPFAKLDELLLKIEALYAHHIR